MGAGKSIHKIDEGFFICGVDALRDHKYLHQLGIKAILNAAQKNLYEMTAMGKGEDDLRQLEKKFEVKIIGADDIEDCNISVHFQEIADFIEAGRKKGGVVIHCAAGVSRASTSCMAYMMIKEHWSLQAAHRRVHAVRSIIHPNSGFWRQLNDLQASLVASGVTLRELPSDYAPPEQPLRPGEEDKFSSTAAESAEAKQMLDAEAKSVQPFVTHYLTAKITAKEATKTSSIQQELERLSTKGVTIENLLVEGEMQQQTDAPGSSEPQKKSSQAAKRWKKALISDKVDNVVQEWKISSVEKQEAAASHKQSRSSRVSASDGRAEQRNSHVLLNPSQGGSTSISVRSGSKDTPRKRSPSSSKEAPRARGSSLTVGKDGKKEPRARSGSRSRKE